jgi:hypothetical protein
MSERAEGMGLASNLLHRLGPHMYCGAGAFPPAPNLSIRLFSAARILLYCSLNCGKAISLD